MPEITAKEQELIIKEMKNWEKKQRLMKAYGIGEKKMPNKKMTEKQEAYYQALTLEKNKLSKLTRTIDQKLNEHSRRANPLGGGVPVPQPGHNIPLGLDQTINCLKMMQQRYHLVQWELAKEAVTRRIKKIQHKISKLTVPKKSKLKIASHGKNIKVANYATDPPQYYVAPLSTGVSTSTAVSFTTTTTTGSWGNS